MLILEGAEGRIVQLSVSSGGVPKRAVESATVTALGLDGDAHRDARHHGGPDRAVCLYSKAMPSSRGRSARTSPSSGWTRAGSSPGAGCGSGPTS